MTPEERLTRIENAIQALTETQARHDTQIEKQNAGIRDLIAVSRTLVDAQLAADGQIEQLGAAHLRTDAQIQQLREAQLRTDAQIQQLREAQLRTDHQIQQLLEALRRGTNG